MSASMYAKTVIADPSWGARVFDTADALMSIEPAGLAPGPGLKAYGGIEGGEPVNEAYGASRRDWFCYALTKLCSLSGTSGLEVFQGTLETPCRWKLPLGIEDGEEEVYGYACGYWLEGPELHAVKDGLVRLLDWSRRNVDLTADADFLGYYADAPDILQATSDGDRMDGPRMAEADGAEDGDGPGYLYAYLGTLSHLVNNAIAAHAPVLHVAEILL